MSATKALQRRNNYIVVVFDSCRYDSFLAGRPRVIRTLGKVERRWSYALAGRLPSHFNLLMGLMPHVSPKNVFASEYYKNDFLRFNERLGCSDFEFKSLMPRTVPASVPERLPRIPHERDGVAAGAEPADDRSTTASTPSRSWTSTMTCARWCAR